MTSTKKRVVSGIQPTGHLHLGNYIGALRQFIDLQGQYECYFFVADLHAITVPQEPADLRDQVRGAVNAYLASGLDPRKVKFFRQSDISAHSELGWLLTTITSMGELNRMTQFKDKAGRQKQDSIGVGLFAYPTLMAADILLYQPELVPVGDDQKQHVELTRDLAQRFNRRFGKVFTVPQPLIRKEAARIMGLDDPSKKMAKSAASDLNRINLADSTDAVRRKISRAVTDSGTEVKGGKGKPALNNLLTILSQLTDTPVGKLESQYRGKSYKEFKDDLADAVIATLKPIQQTLAELEKNPAYTDKVLREGAEKARPVAEKTLQSAKQSMGL
jgi:tryptophanyl-tRNA synthetase